MTIVLTLTAWLGLNYALMARLAYLAALRDGAPVERAALSGLTWPATLMGLARS